MHVLQNLVQVLCLYGFHIIYKQYLVFPILGGFGSQKELV